MRIQQIIIILFIIVFIGLAGYIGYTVVSTNAINSDREQLTSTLYDLGVLAQQYYKRMEQNKNGNGTFIGWSIPAQYRNKPGTFNSLTKNDYVYFYAEGTHKGRNTTTPVRITAKVDMHDIKITIIN
jgi:hypothetical protein